MGSMYVSVIDGLSVSAIADIFYLKPASTRAVVIHEIRLTQETSETSEQLPLKLFRTSTDNSANGTANTPAPLNPNAAASVGATVRTNITGGSLAAETTLLRVESENVLGGWHYLPTPEDRIVIPAGGNGFVAKLKTAPAAALTLSGVMVFEEIG
jgi:hypothetical protein